MPIAHEKLWNARKNPNKDGKVISGKGTRECRYLFVLPTSKMSSDRQCNRCSGNQHGIVRKYGLNMTRRDFREKAETMGWKKVRVTQNHVSFVSLTLSVLRSTDKCSLCEHRQFLTINCCVFNKGKENV